MTEKNSDTGEIDKIISEIFKKFDENKDGSVDRDEFRKACIDVECDLSDIDAVFNLIDADNDGKISLSDLSTRYKHELKEKEDEINELFEKVNAKKTDAIGFDEFRESLSSLGIDDATIVKTFKNIDMDNDGKITLKEFEDCYEETEDEKLARLAKVFKTLDKDLNGVIDRDEFTNKGLEVGLTQGEIDEEFSKIDSNGDGKIDFKEFLISYEKGVAEREIEIKRLIENFKEYDTNKNGFLEFDEYQKVLTDMGFSETDINASFQIIDTDQDGRINLKEFIDALASSD